MLPSRLDLEDGPSDISSLWEPLVLVLILLLLIFVSFVQSYFFFLRAYS